MCGRHRRLDAKHSFNEHFGSMLRTYHQPTHFCARLQRLADVYTSRVTNLLGVHLDREVLFPRRMPLQHEPEISTQSLLAPK